MKRPKIRIRRPRIRIRWRKNSSWWAVGVAVAFFVSLFAFHIVLMRHAESIVRGMLDNRVRQATEGLYSSVFDRIELSYTSKDLIIHNLRFYPDSARLQDPQGKPIALSSAYDILIPELRIEGIALKRAYLNKELSVNRLHIERPLINLYIDFDQQSLAADSLLKQDINKRLAPFFEAIFSQKVEISEGQVDLRTIKRGKKSRIKTTLNLEAWTLAVKTGLQPQDVNWLTVDRFVFQTGATLGYVSDNTYQLKLKSITASSVDSSFFIQGFQLLPTADVPTLLNRKPDLDRIYTIRVPQLYTYGLDFEALYNQKNFQAADITLFSPTMELYDAEARQLGEKENFKPEDLYPAIEKVLNQIAVDKILIRHGRAIVRKREEQVLTNFSVTIRDASVYNFLVDSAAQFQQDKLFYADSLDVQLRDYQLRLSDNLHLLRADELNVNSHKALISAKNLRLEADTLLSLQRQSGALYNVVVPDMQIVGINLHQVYNNNRLVIDSLLVKAPTVRYTQQVKAKKKEKGEETRFQQQDLYGLISDYLYVLNINRLSIDSGTVSLNRNISDSVEVFTTQVQYAHLWNLLIDSTSAYRLNKLFYADNFDLRISSYKHQLPDGIHQIEASSIDISTLKDRILLSGVRLYNLPGYRYPFAEVKNQQSPTLLLIEVPRLELNGVDILNAYLTKKLEVEEVLMPMPKVHIGIRLKQKQQSERGMLSSRDLYALMSDFSEAVIVKNLRLTEAEILTAFYAPNGLLQLNSSNASVSIDNFRFDAYTSQNPKRLFFADAVTVEAQDFLADLPDERYQIRADQLLASTASNSIVAEGVQMQPPHQLHNEQDLLLKGNKGILSFKLPRVRLTGFDFDKAYYQDHLEIDSIVAESPLLSYYQLARNGNREKRSNGSLMPRTSVYESLSPFLQHLSIRNLVLKDGTIRTVARRGDEVQPSLFLDKISISVHDFLLDSAADNNTQRFFFSEDVVVHIGAYRWILPDQEHQVTASNMHLSTLNNLIRASAVKLEPMAGAALSTTSDDRYHVLVPEVVMVGMSFDDIFEKEEFSLQKIDLINPEIEIRQYRSALTEKHTSTRSLAELLSSGFNMVQVKEATLSDGKLRYVRYGGKSPVDVQFPELEARLSNFRVSASKSRTNDRPFFSDNLEVSVRNWKRLLPDSLHWLEAGTLHFSAKDSLFSARQLQIYPDAEMAAPADKTIIRANVPEVRLSGLDYQKLTSDSLILHKLQVFKPHIELLQPAVAATDEKKDSIAAPAEATKKLLSLISSDSLLLTDGTLVLRKPSGGDTSRFELNRIFVRAAGFLYDSIQQHNKNRILYSDDLVAGLKNYKALIGDGFYELEAKEVSLSSASSMLWADSIRLTPTMNRTSFAKQKGVETDQITFRNRRLQVENINLRKLFYNQSFEADKIHMDGFALFLHRDKRQPYPENKRPKMPQELMRNSTWNISITETSLTNGYIAYSEQVKGARDEGFIDLTDVRFEAGRLTNDPELLENGYITKFSMYAKLMGEGALKAHFEIPMGDTLNRHLFYGSLEGMQLAAFNPMLEKTAFISVRSGDVDHINFRVVADKEGATGSMEFEYDNLRVSLVNKKTGKPGGLFRRLGSAVANAFVHTSNTPNDKQEELRKGAIEYERNEERSVVNYWVKTLMDGFKNSIGL